MALLVRTWNVFHGNADPPRRRGFLRAMLRLAVADRPDVLCLQELPVWALPLVDDWTSMRAFGVVTRMPLRPERLSTFVTRLHQGLFRSALAGQANALLVRDRSAVDLGHERVSDRGRERRLVQAVRLDGLVIANLHATNDHARPEIPRTEVERARLFAESCARPGEAVVLAGDFNLRSPRLPGYSAPGPGIDHVLVRGLRASPPVVWPRAERVQNGVVLSDHAPVDVWVG